MTWEFMSEEQKLACSCPGNCIACIDTFVLTTSGWERGGGGVVFFFPRFPPFSIAGLLGIVYRKHLESIAKYLQVCHRQIR